MAKSLSGVYQYLVFFMGEKSNKREKVTGTLRGLLQPVNLIEEQHTAVRSLLGQLEQTHNKPI